MTRLAQNRDTHLTPGEIATEALRQFDEGEGEPSIRSLASGLRVTPSAIYHHYDSRAAIFQAAVELVWAEATAELLELVPQPFAADPGEVLVTTGVTTRRAWLRHYRLAPRMAASPESNEFVSGALGLMADLFERLGLARDQAAGAFHTYSSFMIGAVLFAAARKAANERLAGEGSDRRLGERFRSDPTPGSAGRTSEPTRISLDEVMVVSALDPGRDEDLFAQGLQRLVGSFAELPAQG